MRLRKRVIEYLVPETSRHKGITGVCWDSDFHRVSRGQTYILVSIIQTERIYNVNVQADGLVISKRNQDTPHNIVQRSSYVSNAFKWYDVEDRNVYKCKID